MASTERDPLLSKGHGSLRGRDALAKPVNEDANGEKEDRIIDVDESEQPRRFLCCFVRRNLAAELEVGVLILFTLVFGGMNRVMAKIISVPMGNFSFFLGVFNGFFYTCLYFTILFTRYFLGYIAKDQVRFPWTLQKPSDGERSFFTRLWESIAPWKWFLMMGLCDGLGNVLGLVAQPYVSGTMTALASQFIVLFSALAALVILGTRYTYWQMWSIMLVLSGVVITLVPTFEGDTSEGSSTFYALVMMVSTFPNAISFTLKEMLFRKNPTLDIFVVNSSSSLFQLLLQPLFLPLTLLFNQTMGRPFLEYIRDGFTCFIGKQPAWSTNDCSPNPYPYLIYITINIFFNLCVLLITKRASALLGFMAIKAILPISVVLFFINWPLIGSAPLNYYTLGGLVVVLGGIVLFRIATLFRDRYKLACGSCYLPFWNDIPPEVINN